MINKQPHILAKVLTERGAEFAKALAEREKNEERLAKAYSGRGGFYHLRERRGRSGSYVSVDKYWGQVFIRESGEVAFDNSALKGAAQPYTSKAVGSHSINKVKSSASTLENYFKEVGLTHSELVEKGEFEVLEPYLVRKNSPLRPYILKKFELDSNVGEFYIHAPSDLVEKGFKKSEGKMFLSADLYFEAFIVKELSLLSLEGVEVEIKIMSEEEQELNNSGMEMSYLNNTKVVITLEDGSKIEEPLQPKDLNLTLKALISEQLGKAPSMNGEERKVILKEADMLLDLLGEDSGILNLFLSEL